MRIKNKSIILLLAAVVILAACTPGKEVATLMPVVDEMPQNEEALMENTESPQEMMEIENAASSAWFSMELVDVNTGTAFRIADQKGKVILVEMMAIWCPKCLNQQKEVARLFDLLGERSDFMALGIGVDPNEDAGQLAAYTQKNGFDWAYIVADRTLIDEISLLYGAQFLNPPSTPMLIIDKQGNTHPLPFGNKNAEDLQSALIPFLDSDG